jgi:acetyl esterase/lipase
MPIRLALLLAACCWLPLSSAAEPTVERELHYRAGPALSDYERERCVLDLYLPAGRSGFPTMVWFHGGGIIEGDKDGHGTVAMAERFARDGVAVAVPNYRLSPKVQFPAYIEDAAAAVAWVAAHIQERGGDPKGLFVAGHSAGGYIAALAVMDPSYLPAAGVPAGAVAGLIPVSGQMVTHYQVRAERGMVDAKTRPLLDAAAPCYHVRKDAPPVLAICADHDMAARVEENRYFVALLKVVGHPHAEYLEFAGRNHGTIQSRMSEPADPVAAAALAFIAQQQQKKN